ncbi:MAG: hypothetical protein RR632_07240, partial [Christensenella sp.]
DAAAKITDLMCVGGRSYRNDANNIPNGVTYCNTNTPNGREWYVWQIEYASTDKEQLAFPVASACGVAYRCFGGGAWATWTEMMSKTGGTFSGDVQFNSPPRSGGSGVYTEMRNVGLWSNSGTLHMMSESGLNVVNQGNNGFKPINASAFNVNSSKSVKTDIAEYAGALDKINNAKIYKYTRTDDGAQQIGLITEDVTTPAELKREVEKPNGNGEKPRARAAAKPEMTETIDLYSFISLVSQAVKELKSEKDAEIEVLKSKITALEGK